MTLDAGIRRTLVNPYWVDDPLAWEDGDAGIAFFAREGRVGMFNLALIVLDVYTPPKAEVYRARPIRWVITHAPTFKVGDRTLEELASLLTLSAFCKKVQASRLFKTSPPLNVLLVGGINRMTNDIRSGRITG